VRSVGVSRQLHKAKTLALTAISKVKGRKRHLLIDTPGPIVAMVVIAANADDRQGLVSY
jgi:hypothetical protein